MTTKYQPTFDEFKAICKEHGLIQTNPTYLRRFYFNRVLVVSYNTFLHCPIACNELLDDCPHMIKSKRDLITYIEQAKLAIAESAEKAATTDLLNQIEQL